MTIVNHDMLLEMRRNVLDGLHMVPAIHSYIIECHSAINAMQSLIALAEAMSRADSILGVSHDR